MARMAELVQSKYWESEEADAVLEAWRQSGESLAAFCRMWGISPKRLRYWLKRPGSETNAGLEVGTVASTGSEDAAAAPSRVFHELSVKAPQDVVEPVVERRVVARVERGQWSVVVPHGFDRAELGRLLCLVGSV